nr:EOG090X080D [Triops cancriformis]
MLSISNEKRFPTFDREHQLLNIVRQKETKYVKVHTTRDNGVSQPYVVPKEEQLLLRTYELQLREFCRKFQPPMPRFVVGTALQYMKRFYLVNSAMDYHPKEILVTCIYLACKVEEFNVSIDQFVSNIRGDRERAANIILDNELLLMQQLSYHLTVHNPFRAMEGLLIDIKTRCATMKDPEKLRPGIDEFLEKVYMTDSLFLFSPSQVALAAIIHAASKLQENMDVYVTETLFNGAKQELMSSLIESIRKIRLMVRNIEQPQREIVKNIERKLAALRIQEEGEVTPRYGAHNRVISDRNNSLHLTRAEIFTTRTNKSQMGTMIFIETEVD